MYIAIYSNPCKFGFDQPLKKIRPTKNNKQTPATTKTTRSSEFAIMLKLKAVPKNQVL